MTYNVFPYENIKSTSRLSHLAWLMSWCQAGWKSEFKWCMGEWLKLRVCKMKMSPLLWNIFKSTPQPSLFHKLTLQFCIYLYRHSSIFPAELPAVTADCRSHEDFRFHLSYFLFLKNGVFSFSTRFGCPFGDCTPRRIPINDRWILPTVTSLGAIHHVRASWPAALIER